MKTKLTKRELAGWLVKELTDCGKIDYFNNPLTHSPLTDEEAFKRFMKMGKDELFSHVYDLNDDGQEFLRQNGYDV
jgi:hypothetical protein